MINVDFVLWDLVRSGAIEAIYHIMKGCDAVNGGDLCVQWQTGMKSVVCSCSC